MQHCVSHNSIGHDVHLLHTEVSHCKTNCTVQSEIFCVFCSISAMQKVFPRKFLDRNDVLVFGLCHIVYNEVFFRKTMSTWFGLTVNCRVMFDWWIKVTLASNIWCRPLLPVFIKIVSVFERSNNESIRQSFWILKENTMFGSVVAIYCTFNGVAAVVEYSKWCNGIAAVEEVSQS